MPAHAQVRVSQRPAAVMQTRHTLPRTRALSDSAVLLGADVGGGPGEQARGEYNNNGQEKRNFEHRDRFILDHSCLLTPAVVEKQGAWTRSICRGFGQRFSSLGAIVRE